MTSLTVFGVRIDDVDNDQLFEKLSSLRGLVTTPNPEILLASRSNQDYRNLLNSSALSLPDGIAVRFAVAALDGWLGLHRHTGVDIVPKLAVIASINNETLILLGGDKANFIKLQNKLSANNPALRIICIDPGKIDENHPELYKVYIDQICELGPSIIAVGLGQGRGGSQGKQERICQQILNECSNVRLAIGIGGAFDMLSGKSKRAPMILRRLGFEWAWRLVIEPWRWRRIYRATIVFPLLVTYDTIKHRKLLRAIKFVTQDLYLHFTK